MIIYLKKQQSSKRITYNPKINFYRMKYKKHHCSISTCSFQNHAAFNCRLLKQIYNIFLIYKKYHFTHIQINLNKPIL